MKLLTCTAILLLLIMTTPVKADKLTPTELCNGVESLAQASIKAYQNNVNLNQAMETINTNMAKAGETWLNVSRGILLDAYDQPLYNSEKLLILQIQNFKNKWTRKCWLEFIGPIA